MLLKIGRPLFLAAAALVSILCFVLGTKATHRVSAAEVKRAWESILAMPPYSESLRTATDEGNFCEIHAHHEILMGMAVRLKTMEGSDSKGTAKELAWLNRGQFETEYGIVSKDYGSLLVEILRGKRKPTHGYCEGRYYSINYHWQSSIKNYLRTLLDTAHLSAADIGVNESVLGP